MYSNVPKIPLSNVAPYFSQNHYPKSTRICVGHFVTNPFRFSRFRDNSNKEIHIRSESCFDLVFNSAGLELFASQKFYVHRCQQAFGVDSPA